MGLIWPEEDTKRLVEESRKRGLGNNRAGYTWYYLDKINRGDARIPVAIVELVHDVLGISYDVLFKLRRKRLLALARRNMSLTASGGGK